MGLLAGTIFDRPPHCERCDRLESECECLPESITPSWKRAADQTARLITERRSKGKLVTLVKGLAATESDLPQLLKQLKNACAAGGTIVDDVLEIQGDHLDRVRKTLLTLGYRVR